MPQVTVYIRKEDLPKWEAVDKKSEFIHNVLNEIDYSFPKVIKTPEDAKKAAKTLTPKAVTYKPTNNWGA